MNAIFGWLQSVWSALLGLIRDLISWVGDTINSVAESVFTLLGNLISSYITPYIDLQPAVDAVNYIQPLTWLIPIWSLLGIWVAGYSVRITIRVMRHSLGAIPFMNLG